MNKVLSAKFFFQRKQENFSLLAKLDCSAPCIIGIKGDMGIGKTTLFDCLSGITQPRKGYFFFRDKIYFNHKKKIWQPLYKRDIAYLFQEDRIFPHLSVRSNLLYGCKWKKKPSLHPHFTEIIDLLGLEPLLQSKKANQLSGGESRRLSIGRTLLSSFELLLLDEPFRSLSETQVQAIITYLKKRKDIYILFTSHHDKYFSMLADFVVQVKKGNSTIFGRSYFCFTSSFK